MWTRLTVASGSSKAAAIASSTRPSCESDPEVVGHRLDDVLGGRRVEAIEEGGQPLELGRGATRGLDLGEGGADLLQRGRLGMGVPGEHLLGPVAGVGVLQVDAAQLLGVGAG